MNAFDRITDSINAIASGASADLASLAEQAGMSPFHFQRTFQKLVGVSPLRFQQVLAVDKAREALQRSKSVLDASLDAGFSGPSRLHDAMVHVERMTPGELKAGVTMRWSTAETDLGAVTIAKTERGICGLSFEGLEPIQSRFPNATFTRDDRELRHDVKRVEALLAGEHLDQPLSVALHGTDLQIAVWRALLTIPEGALTTYSDLASRIDRPTAHRAVANAIGANPVAILIPCHRVIRASGALGGYRWGTDRKAALLARELNSHGQLRPVVRAHARAAE